MSRRVPVAAGVSVGLFAIVVVFLILSRRTEERPPGFGDIESRLDDLADQVDRLEDHLAEVGEKLLEVSRDLEEDSLRAAPREPPAAEESATAGAAEAPSTEVEARVARLERRLRALEQEFKAQNADPVRRAFDLVATGDVKLREKGIDLLAKFAGSVPEAHEALLELLKDSDGKVRVEAALALAKLRDPSAPAALRSLYVEGAGDNALLVAVALKKLGDDGPLAREVGRLSQLAVTGETEDVRRDALKGLARHARDESRDTFLQAMNDSSERVRKEAERVLKDSAKPPKPPKPEKIKAKAAKP